MQWWAAGSLHSLGAGLTHVLLDFVDCKIDVYMYLYTIASTVCLQGNLKTVGYVNSKYKYIYIYTVIYIHINKYTHIHVIYIYIKRTCNLDPVIVPACANYLFWWGHLTLVLQTQRLAGCYWLFQSSTRRRQNLNLKNGTGWNGRFNRLQVPY